MKLYYVSGEKMKTVREVHHKAMQLATLAIVAQHKGKRLRAKRLTRRAYEHEVRALSLLPLSGILEPTRGILYRSAASLAFQCGKLQEARKLAQKGLAGNPVPGVRQELNELLEKIANVD